MVPADAEPFLRWAGGKRWLAARLAATLHERLACGGTYYEPFLGSGAMFFAVSPKRARLSDLNADLIATFQMVASDAAVLTTRLAERPSDAETYYRIRASRPDDPIERAVRFIYLNRNCYGGLYRENRNGEFNVPYGGGSRHHKGICNDGTLARASAVLARPGIHLSVADFQVALRSARRHDVVYCDPTYRKVTREHFDRYGKTIFGWDDQIRLASACREAVARGALVLVSNAFGEDIEPLYEGAIILQVQRTKGLGPDAGQLSETLVIWDPAREKSTWEQLGKRQID